MVTMDGSLGLGGISNYVGIVQFFRRVLLKLPRVVFARLKLSFLDMFFSESKPNFRLLWTLEYFSS